jgi:DEAD/DEAH box helicase domain-containing protein
VATLAVMAEPRDLQKAVGSGDGAWFVDARVAASWRGSEPGAAMPRIPRASRRRCSCTTTTPAASA